MTADTLGSYKLVLNKQNLERNVVSGRVNNQKVLTITRLKRIESKIAREAASKTQDTSKAQNTSNTQYTSYTQNTSKTQILL